MIATRRGGWALGLPVAAAMLFALAPAQQPGARVGALMAATAGASCAALLYAILSGLRRGHLRPVPPLLLIAALVLGSSEEVVWRGWVAARLVPAVGSGLAIAAAATGFALTHYPAQRLRGVVVHLGTGTAFGAVYVGTGSLLAAVSAHAVYNGLALAVGRPPASAAGALGPPVEARGVEKRFGDVPALRGVDVDIEPGEVVALLGPNGAGKTTFVSIVLGLRRPDRGSVRVLGRRPGSLEARREVATTPQEMSFPPTLRVCEVVSFVLAHRRDCDSPETLLARFDLGDLARRQVGGLSAGQRRRLGLALSLGRRPRLAVLDEPTTGLDVEARLQAWTAIREFGAAGGTVLLTTHHLEEAEALASRIVVARRGLVVANGTASELRSSGGSLEEAYLRLTGACA